MWQWTLTPGSSGSSSLSSSFPSHSLPPFQSKLPTQLTQVVPALLGAATSIRDWLQGRAISISSSSSLGKKITRLLTQKTTSQRLWALPPVLWNALIEGARSLFATLWELEEEQVTVRCAPWAFLHFRWLRSGFAALLAISSYYSTKFKMFLPKITYKGHCCTPAPAGCTLSGSYPRIWCHLISQRVPSLRHWSHSSLLTLVNPVCSTGPWPNKGIHLYTASSTVCVITSGAHSQLWWGWDQGWGNGSGASHALTWTGSLCDNLFILSLLIISYMIGASVQ